MLSTVIDWLKTRSPEEIPPLGFCNPHSYRGDYAQVAFEPTTGVSVAEMLESCNKALENVFTGWKGGEFTYDLFTQCWLSQVGIISHQTLTPCLLSLMFGEVPSEQSLKGDNL